MITQFNAFIALDNPRKYVFKSQREQNCLLSNESSSDIKDEVTTTPTPKRESIKHMLIGSSKAVMGTIHVLHQLGYAEVSDWSPLLPSPTNPGEVMSILVRQILVK